MSQETSIDDRVSRHFTLCFPCEWLKSRQSLNQGIYFRVPVYPRGDSFRKQRESVNLKIASERGQREQEKGMP